MSQYCSHFCRFLNPIAPVPAVFKGTIRVCVVSTVSCSWRLVTHVLCDFLKIAGSRWLTLRGASLTPGWKTRCSGEGCFCSATRWVTLNETLRLDWVLHPGHRDPREGPFVVGNPLQPALGSGFLAVSFCGVGLGVAPDSPSSRGVSVSSGVLALREGLGLNSTPGRAWALLLLLAL